MLWYRQWQDVRHVEQNVAMVWSLVSIDLVSINNPVLFFACFLLVYGFHD